MRDLIDDPHPEFTAAMMADLTGAGMPQGLRQEPTGGDFAVGRSSVHAGASEGAQRASERAAVEKLTSLGFEWRQGAWVVRPTVTLAVTVHSDPEAMNRFLAEWNARARLVPVPVQQEG